MPRFRPRFAALAVVAGAGLAVVVPVFAAGNTNATLSDYKIAGPASAKAGVVTFKVKNAAGGLHELVVIKTPTKAAKMKTKNGRASEAGSLGEVEVKGGGTKALVEADAQAGPLRAPLQCRAALQGRDVQGLHGELKPGPASAGEGVHGLPAHAGEGSGTATRPPDPCRRGGRGARS